MQLQEIRKTLRRKFAPVGWTMVLYYLLMNVIVAGVMVAELVIKVVAAVISRTEPDMDALIEGLYSNGWGYILTIIVGLGILLLWKKPAFFRQQICKPGKPMRAGSFLSLLCVFMSGQLVFQLLAMVMEMVANLFDFSIMDAMESASMSTDTLSMFLYACLGAPIAEELLFRGLILRTLEPYGKRFAIFASALTFGIFHGNPVQSPYAFAVGLVLGYTAMEYNFFWAIALHMFNNLVLGDLLGRILAPLGTMWEEIITYAVIIGFAVAALVILICRRKEVADYFRKGEKMDIWCVDSFLSTPSIIIFILMLSANGLVFLFM